MESKIVVREYVLDFWCRDWMVNDLLQVLHRYLWTVLCWFFLNPIFIAGILQHLGLVFGVIFILFMVFLYLYLKIIKHRIPDKQIKNSWVLGVGKKELTYGAPTS
jgi:hypothetical protein